ncbi:MAG: GntR family transcriptional regulator [Cryobacterium sp.]|nr:GntR family transcriptional regulator [Micrococcales bacterium]MBX3077920.1 GntR family transcriptional regulator [Cryobacterium sp.]MBX3310934.1 GntR family transcriptional regulator [Cryobacterium sp.]MCB1280291.1 GntR family transcriptional regulator [Salinibacterium sp.]HMM83687.1 GntR family transcriptional regulator [Terrimesophilobacter sp.]
MVASDSTQLKKHELVRQHLKAKINQGLAPHEKLPTERDLAEQLNVNRLTIRHALGELEREGVIYRVQGSGTFVSASQISKSFEFTSFSEDMRMRDMVPGSLSAELSVEAAGMKVGYALNLSPTTPVVHVRRVRTADEVPICVEDVCIPHALVPGLENGINGNSLYEDLAERFAITVERADQTIQATVLNESDAAELLVPPFSPAFHVQRTAFDSRGRAVEYAESLYRGDRYSYTVSITRPAHLRET